MKKTCIAVIAVFSMLIIYSPARADDMGWLQPGVRVWYVGGVSGGSSTDESTPITTNVQEANLFDSYQNGVLNVIQQQASGNWTTPLPIALWANPNPSSEGIFWINPQRLQAMKAGQWVDWVGTQRLVYARTTYTAATVPILKLLPLEELFRLKPEREFVILTNVTPGETSAAQGTYYFDVETGLLFGRQGVLGIKKPGGKDDEGKDKEDENQFTRNLMVISEINYDFSTRRAYPEDAGPHSAYYGRFSATRPEYLNNQGFQIDSMVLSRYSNVIMCTLHGDLMNIAGSKYYPFDYYIYYDGNLGKAYSRSSKPEAWTENGDHLLWWIPPADLALNSIKIWNLNLQKQAGGGATTFATSDFSQTGFPSLSFDAEGYLSDITVNAPDMGLYVESRSSPDKNITIAGRSFYATQMKPAVPTNVPITNPSCAASSVLYDDSVLVNGIRALRNNILLKTPAGKYYIKQYYAYSRELIEILERNASARQKAVHVLKSITPYIPVLLQNRMPQVPDETVEELRELCDAFYAEATIGLREVIRNLRIDIDAGVFFEKPGMPG